MDSNSKKLTQVFNGKVFHHAEMCDEYVKIIFDDFSEIKVSLNFRNSGLFNKEAYLKVNANL